MTGHKDKFDVVVMNPPYQAPVQKSDRGGGARNIIWPQFVRLAINLTKDHGYIAAIHPPKWRKPDDDLFPNLKKYDIIYLEMHSKNEGKNVFGYNTPYDWYIMNKSSYKDSTVIIDYNNNSKCINLNNFSFLPNCKFDIVSSLIAKDHEEKCEVLYSYRFHETRRTWMNKTKTKKFKYPCVHSTNDNKGISYWYSSERGGFFGVPKYIFGYSYRISNGIVDFKGEYGMTQGTIGIPISSKEEGENIKKALESEEFNDLIKSALTWSHFIIDWRMFRYFRKDFWKQFL